MQSAPNPITREMMAAILANVNDAANLKLCFILLLLKKPRKTYQRVNNYGDPKQRLLGMRGIREHFTPKDNHKPKGDYGNKSDGS